MNASREDGAFACLEGRHNIANSQFHYFWEGARF